jgi:hypothetical protein
MQVDVKIVRRRIEDDARAFGGILPERYALAWGGYLAALMEWGLITPVQHKTLIDLLPKFDGPDDPVLSIFIGRDD